MFMHQGVGRTQTAVHNGARPPAHAPRTHETHRGPVTMQDAATAPQTPVKQKTQARGPAVAKPLTNRINKIDNINI